ncbi:MAG: hypothetical protein IPM13_16965 [Phycisphaerales bacterium]|nr:hypothetical protein [Phycisphaerales bacterium]
MPVIVIVTVALAVPSNDTATNESVIVSPAESAWTVPFVSSSVYVHVPSALST